MGSPLQHVISSVVASQLLALAVWPFGDESVMSEEMMMMMLMTGDDADDDDYDDDDDDDDDDDGGTEVKN